MFSKACEYAIRASIIIAYEATNGKRMSLIEIADRIDSPEAFTAKILQKLVKNNIITSVKGPGGGFDADVKNLHKVKLFQIITAIDGSILDKCSLGLNECSEKQPCPFHQKYKPIKEKLLLTFHETSLKDLTLGFRNGNTFLKI